MMMSQKTLKEAIGENLRARKITFTLAILALCLHPMLFADIPSPLTTDDTLVAIPVLRISTRSTDNAYTVSYQINLENVESGKTYPLNFDVGSSNDYEFVRGLPPGQYIVRDYASYGLINSPNRPLSVQKPLVLEKGKMSLLPIKAISIIFTRNRDNRALYSIDFDEYDERQKNRMIEILSKSKNFAKWTH